MSLYKILSWDPIMYQGNLMASVIIEPDLNLLKMFQNALGNNIPIEISGTQTESYDNHRVYAIINKSAGNNSDDKEKLMNGSGYYILTLGILWNGFPLHNGIIKIIDTQNNTQNIQTTQNKKVLKSLEADPIPNPTNCDCSCNCKKNNVHNKIVCIAVLSLLAIYLLNE